MLEPSAERAVVFKRHGGRRPLADPGTGIMIAAYAVSLVFVERLFKVVSPS